MKYTELKDIMSSRVSNFKGIFFAFSDKQLKEGMGSLGLSEDDTLKIISIGGGAYLLKEKVKDFHALIDANEKELSEYLKTKEGLKDALKYELGNHEYCITYDLDEAMSALGLSSDDITKDNAPIIKEAVSEYLKESEAYN